MKKRVSLIFVLVLLTVLAIPGLAGASPSAAGVPGIFRTKFRVQNLSTSAAFCSYDVYTDASSTVAATAQIGPATGIPAQDSAYVAVADNTSVPTGTTSAVISCSEQVAVAVIVEDTQASNKKTDAYNGVSAPATTLYAPSTYDNYYNYYTSIRLQNASGVANNVTVQFFAPGAATPARTDTFTIEANRGFTLDQVNKANLATNVSYSAKITGSQPLAAVVSIYGIGTATQKQLYAYTAFAQGALKLFAPSVFRNYYGYNSQTIVQNIGTATATVKYTYSNGKTLTVPLGRNSSLTINDFMEDTFLANRLYSNTIESLDPDGAGPATAQPLIAIVNESTPSTQRATTYAALDVGDTAVAAPYLTKRYLNYNTSASCQNVGSTIITAMTINYRGATFNGSRPVELPLSGGVRRLRPGATVLVYPPADTGVPDNFFGNATINATGGTIGCVMNSDQNEGTFLSQTEDKLAAYNAVNTP